MDQSLNHNLSSLFQLSMVVVRGIKLRKFWIIAVQLVLDVVVWYTGKVLMVHMIVGYFAKILLWSQFLEFYWL